MQITGIILSGGQSKRMGNDKAFIQNDGKTLLENAFEICAPFCSTVLISSNNQKHEIHGTKIIPDEIINCGPLAGIYTCLKKSGTSWNFVISVDAAFVTSEFVTFLLSQAMDYDAVVPVHTFGKEPLIALYNKSALPEMRKRLEVGNFKMHDLLNSLKTKYVDSQEWVERFPKLFRNLNRPEDL